MILPRLTALAVVLAAAACAAIAPPFPEAPPFDLSGRVMVSYDGRAFTSGLRWRHESRGDEIALLTPLGQTLARIGTGPEGATLTTVDQQQYHATNVASLTRRGLGWALPLEPLRYWVRGEIAPGATPAKVVRDAAGRLVLLEQAGWHITFVNDTPGEGRAEPRRLDLRNDGERIRLVIDRWRPSPPTQ